MERLRHVARATGVPQAALVKEAADALSMVGNDPAGLVTASRRVMAQQPNAAALVYLCARMLCSDKPQAEAWAVVDELDNDRTERELGHALPEDARVCLLGAPDQLGKALRRRGDVEALVVDVFGEGSSLVQRLQSGSTTYDPYAEYYDDYDEFAPGFGEMPDANAGSAVEVPLSGLGSAAADADMVVLEALAVGPGSFLGPAGSRAAAAVASHAGKPVWLVGGVGRLLPGRMWDGLLSRLDSSHGFDTDEEIVPLDLITQVASPNGLQSVADALASTDCPIVPELF